MCLSRGGSIVNIAFVMLICKPNWTIAACFDSQTSWSLVGFWHKVLHPSVYSCTVRRELGPLYAGLNGTLIIKNTGRTMAPTSWTLVSSSSSSSPYDTSLEPKEKAILLLYCYIVCVLDDIVYYHNTFLPVYTFFIFKCLEYSESTKFIIN
jgi:hypothetical protein